MGAKRTKKHSFKVTVSTSCTKAEAKEYIRVAVARWCKGYDCTTPEWEIGDSVKVTEYKVSSSTDKHCRGRVEPSPL